MKPGATIARGTSLAVAICVTTACGVATSDDVEVANPDDVPFGLLEPDREPVTLRPASGTVVELHLFDPDSGALVPVVRQVGSTGVGALVAELEAGPTNTESLLGLRSALADVDAVGEIAVEGATATVDLEESFATLGGSDQIVAIAQLVFTLTGSADVDRLVVTVDGEPVELPRADGTLTSDPVSRSDYDALAPPR